MTIARDIMGRSVSCLIFTWSWFQALFCCHYSAGTVFFLTFHLLISSPSTQTLSAIIMVRLTSYHLNPVLGIILINSPSFDFVIISFLTEIILHLSTVG